MTDLGAVAALEFQGIHATLIDLSRLARLRLSCNLTLALSY